ncbi:MAG: hypothetical protein FWE72_01890 [Spirochaetaceae bacterium]|nr:hypothetical protein [Spirochaetaceae bacterium]
MAKKIIAIALFIVIFPMLVFSEKKPGKEFLLKARMTSKKGIENLISIGNSRYQILFMDFRESEKQVFNIYTPYADLGRISATGLLREIKNPAVHYPGSQIFNEKTRIVPDRRLKATGNRGIRIDAGNIVSGFFEEGESTYSNLSWKGIYSGKKIGKRALINFAVTEYDERDDGQRNIWYADRKIRYGRKVTNAAFSASYKTGLWGISSAGAMSHYKGANNGLYFRLSPYLRYSFIKLDFILSGTGDSYIKPDGSFPATTLRKGIAALITPVPWIRINTRYVTDVLHKKESDIRYGGYTEELFGSVVLRPWFIESGFSAKNRNIYKDNYFNNYIDTSVFIGMKGGFNKIVFEKKDTYKDHEKISQTYRIEAGAGIKNISLYTLWKLKEGIDEKEINITSRARIKVRKISLFSEYKIVSVERQTKADKKSTEYTIGVDAKF